MQRAHKGDHWDLYRQLEDTIQAIEETADPGKALTLFVDSLVRDYHDSLGITGGRLFRRDDDHYELLISVGEWGGETAATARPGYRVPASYGAIQALREHGVLIADRSDPSYDPDIETPLAVSTFAAIAVGTGDRWIISFSLSPEARKDQILYSLSTVRHVLTWKMHQFDVQEQILRVREIQRSLFPVESPRFPGYDLYGRSRPTETVGGDVFDFIPLSDNIFGILVADSSGHGLAAALQARDVIMGMRMGLEEDLKLIRVIKKLNRVIHQTSLSSKFVTLFYGELESNGNFIYCNAGHCPALFFDADREEFELLRRGGRVLGPTPDARYERGYVRMDSGDVLVLYSDGITEAHGAGGEEFGTERIKTLVREFKAHSAEEITEAIFTAVDAFAPDDPLRDDRTVVVARRNGNSPTPAAGRTSPARRRPRT